jgi:hypothetical protein
MVIMMQMRSSVFPAKYASAAYAKTRDRFLVEDSFFSGPYLLKLKDTL